MLVKSLGFRELLMNDWYHDHVTLILLSLVSFVVRDFRGKRRPGVG